jgi:hypothetical protein
VIRILDVEPIGYTDEARAILSSLGEVVESSTSRAELPSYDVLIVRPAHQIGWGVLDAGRRLRVAPSATTAESMAKTEVFMARKLAEYLEQNRATRSDALGSDR